MQGDRINRRLL